MLQPLPGTWLHPGSSGRTVVILGAIHGDEPGGAEIVKALAQEPPTFWADCADTVLLVIGNPPALSQGIRCTRTGTDLNRLFGPGDPQGDSWEHDRARALRPLLAKADLLLDLHETQRPIPPLAVVSDTPAHLAEAARLGLKFAVVGVERIYGTSMAAHWVDRCGGIGLTLETGQAGAPGARRVADHAARAALGQAVSTHPLTVYEIHGQLPTPAADLTFLRPLSSGDTIQQGELLGQSSAGPLHAPEDAVIFLPRERTTTGEACMLLAHIR